MTATQTKWAERVQTWRASGKTAEEYASRLKTAPAEKPSSMVRVVRRASSASVAEPVGPDVQSEVEVTVGGARILVRRGFDAELLRQVAAALGGAR
jgi:hypothetical protein